MLRVICVLFLLAMLIYSLIDCVRTDESEMPARISKPIWVVAIAIIPVLGATLWLGFKVQKIIKADASFNSSDLTAKFRRDTSSTAPLAPDDDPDFLSRLDAQNRRRQYEQRKAENKLNSKDDISDEPKDDSDPTENEDDSQNI